MGSSGSTHTGQVVSETATVARPPEPPYSGPNAEYHFVNTQVQLHTPFRAGYTVTRIVTSNVDDYYPMLQQLLEQGYKMLTFYQIPGEFLRSGGPFSSTVHTTYQGIFCRYPERPQQERYQLRVDKSVIEPKRVKNNEFFLRSIKIETDTTHLIQAIANNTQTGGRLVCIELTGRESKHLTHGGGGSYKIPAKGVDLFFVIPIHDSGKRYMYHVVTTPISITFVIGSNPRVDCDWLGILGQQLSQGYRLVEIFMDEAEIKEPGKFHKNSLWVFEKPSSRADDHSPVYQGTIVEHDVTVARGIKTTPNWEPVIQDMGNRGWELACILETPERRASGIFNIKQKCVLFFQRKICP